MTARSVSPPGLEADALVIDRLELAELYAQYADALDDGEYERWPTFFTKACSYFITTKENVERAWGIQLLACESREAMIDRISAIRNTLFYMPRTQRRIVSGARILSATRASAQTSASFAVFETLVGEHTTLFATGRFVDIVRYEDGSLKIEKRTCVLDASLISNSLPFPL
jgi:salicylate 5-hydroxylase small subunit